MPKLEQIAPREQEHIEEMVRLMTAFVAKRDKGSVVERMFHPKMHACLHAQFTVEADLPPELQQGLFKQANTYQAWVRFSNAPPKTRPDTKASGRGLALKILEVPGETIEADPLGGQNQDFLLTTSPVLSPGHVANYRRSLIAITKGFPHNVPYLLTPSNWRRIYLTLHFMRKHQSLLDTTYFTGSPFLFGEHHRAAKFSLRPGNPPRSWTKGKGEHFLQERLTKDLTEQDFYFDFLVQLQEDPKTEPVEDSSREWKTPFHKIGSLRLPRQDFSSEDRIDFGQNLRFSPWHCLAAHRPLGGINRARRVVYNALAQLR